MTNHLVSPHSQARVMMEWNLSLDNDKHQSGTKCYKIDQMIHTDVHRPARAQLIKDWFVPHSARLLPFLRLLYHLHPVDLYLRPAKQSPHLQGAKLWRQVQVVHLTR